MEPDDPRRRLRRITTTWADDPSSGVVWAGEHDGRWGIRIAQDTREATTIWFDVGALTVGFEAHLLPAPVDGGAAMLRHCLRRNRRSWPAAITLDDHGDLTIQGRISVDSFDEQRLGQAVGAVAEIVELSFRPLLDLLVDREKTP